MNWLKKLFGKKEVVKEIVFEDREYGDPFLEGETFEHEPEETIDSLFEAVRTLKEYEDVWFGEVESFDLFNRDKLVKRVRKYLNQYQEEFKKETYVEVKITNGFNEMTMKVADSNQYEEMADIIDLYGGQVSTNYILNGLSVKPDAYFWEIWGLTIYGSNLTNIIPTPQTQDNIDVAYGSDGEILQRQGDIYIGESGQYITVQEMEDVYHAEIVV